MLTRRVIPVVLMRNGLAVQSKGFRRYQPLGNPVTIVERLSDWASDELIYLDISRTPRYDLGRDDLAAENRGEPIEILRDIASRCFMPLTFGGRIRTVDEAALRIENGADKVTLNSAAIERPELITEASDIFGSQCVVVCIDAMRDSDNWRVASEGGHKATEHRAVEWARRVEQLGAGEILLQSIDQDGRGSGYDLRLIEAVAAAVKIPVIALGGAGTWEHLGEALDAGADAVAAANIFNHSEQSVLKAKRWLSEHSYNVRAVPRQHSGRGQAA